MKAKHSIILLSGLLLLMIGIAWAQVRDTAPPTCPVVIYEANVNASPYGNASKWVRADWNSNADRWEIDCSSDLPSANAMANAFYPENAYNAVTNHANVLPSRRGSRTNNGNYVNKNPYKATPDMNVYIGANANATNAINAARPARREPNTRRPGLPN